MIGELWRLDAGGLRIAIETTFARRGTHAVPPSLPSPPADWGPRYRQLAEEVGAQPELDAGHRAAAALLDPILKGDVSTGSWHPERRRWEA